MKADVVVTLTHDGQRWVARSGSLEAAGATLPELDDALRRELQGMRQYRAGAQVTVFMGFDVDTLPRWMRQYSAHYFNRCVRLQIER